MSDSAQHYMSTPSRLTRTQLRRQIRNDMIDTAQECREELVEDVGYEDMFARTWENFILSEFLEDVEDLEEISLIKSMSDNIRDNERQKILLSIKGTGITLKTGIPAEIAP